MLANNQEMEEVQASGFIQAVLNNPSFTQSYYELRQALSKLLSSDVPPPTLRDLPTR